MTSINSKYAKWFLLASLGIFIAFDIWLEAAGHTTISEFLSGVIYKHPWSPIGLIIFGVVLGHICWGQKIKD